MLTQEDALDLDDNIITLDGDSEDDSGFIDAAEFQAALLAAQRQQMGLQVADDSQRGRADDEFWSQDQERVFLVGVTLKGSNGAAGPQGGRARGGQASGSGNGNGSLPSLKTEADWQQLQAQQHQSTGYDVHASLAELGRLADTAGLKVVGSTYQALDSINNATYIGSGKVAEVARAVRAYNIDTVIFDDELSPGQLRNLEKAFTDARSGEPGLDVRVCDRTALILDIFSQRARTREGKLQVELAQTEYQLPRLTRMWTHLDRVSGGGQVKGTGEKQIEIDKRLLRDKAAQLRRDLEAVRTHRKAYRTRRQQTPVPVVALVGYTNAGKSTLLNTLTQAGVLAEDKLFATLDPTTRRVRLPGNTEVLMSDTVGFIQKLPTQLVASFRATLEEIQEASIVLHVVDVSADSAAAQYSAVLQVLGDIGVDARTTPIITAWNKVDAHPDPPAVRAAAAGRPDTVVMSGASGEGVEDLLLLIQRKLADAMVDVEVLLPYSAGDLLDSIHTLGNVHSVEYQEGGSYVRGKVPAALAGRLAQYAVGEDDSA